MTSWEVFEGSHRRRHEDAPMVTPLRGEGLAFALNPAAVAAMGEPEAVVLLWSEADRCVGFRPTAASDPRAYRLRRFGKSGGKSRHVSGGAFRKRYGLEGLPATRIPARMEGGVLVVDLSDAEGDDNAPTA